MLVFRVPSLHLLVYSNVDARTEAGAEVQLGGSALPGMSEALDSILALPDRKQ